MARRFSKKRRSSGKSKSIPLAIVAPLAYTGYEMVTQFMGGNKAMPQYMLTGVNANGVFNSGRLVQTYAPILAGVVVHKVAQRVGVNNIVRKATMGYLSI